MKKTLLALALALAASVAQAIPLTTLLGGGSITAGDKLFDNWSVLFEDSSSGNSVDTDNIEVTALNDGGMDPGPGLNFAVSGNELSVTGNGVYAYIDFKFGFKVSVLDPTKQIKDNSLQLTGGGLTTFVAGSEDLGFTIFEDVGTSPGSADLATRQVEFSRLAGALTSNVSDSGDFASQSQIWVTKEILVWAVDAGDNANLTGFNQRFSQTTVPEPGSLALLSLALAGLGLARRRRS